MMFTIKDSQVFGYDKSQIDLYDKRIANEGHEPISEADALAILNPSKPLHELESAAIALVNAEYTRRMGAIAEAYPVHERESWSVQVQEARELAPYLTSGEPLPEDVETPWIDACAVQRSLTREELARRILEKDAGYRKVSGFLTGVRQNHEDQIATLLAAGEESREDLQNYWYLEGWDPQ